MNQEFIGVYYGDKRGMPYGYFNTHNSHICNAENLHAIHKLYHHQWKFSVNIWAGIVDNNYVVGPYLFTAR